MQIAQTPDPTFDTVLENDVPRPPGRGEQAAIGDSITVQMGGDRIRVTVLAVLDPAPVDDQGIDLLFDRLGAADIGDLLATPTMQTETRYIAVQLRVRNLDSAEPGRVDTVHVELAGTIVDRAGEEHRSRLASIKGCRRVVPPQRDEPSGTGCVPFRLPPGAVAERFIVNYSGNPIAAWHLTTPEEVVGPPRVSASKVPDLVQLLKSGVTNWNRWRATHQAAEIDLSEADLRDLDLRGADLSRANLSYARFHNAKLADADLRDVFARGALFLAASMERCKLDRANLADASLFGAYTGSASFRRANLRRAMLSEINAYRADFRGADLREIEGHRANLALTTLAQADLRGAKLAETVILEADLSDAKLAGASFDYASLSYSKMNGARLHETSLVRADLHSADLSDAELEDCDLTMASLVGAKLHRARLRTCRIYGIAAWNIEGQPDLQEELIITRQDEGRLTVSDLEVAQFIYLILNNRRLQNVFNTLTERGVLLLGRFGGGGLEILRQVADNLRAQDYVPIIFEFARGKDRNLTETVKTLVGISRFVIVDLSGPSIPQELMATVPFYKIPFVPILEKGRHPYAMFADLLEYPWVVKPILEFPDVASLLDAIPEKVIAPAEAGVESRQAKLRDLFGK